MSRRRLVLYSVLLIGIVVLAVLLYLMAPIYLVPRELKATYLLYNCSMDVIRDRHPLFTYEIPARNGRSLRDSLVYDVTDCEFAYWSPDDRAIAVTRTGKTRWFLMPRGLVSGGWRVERLEVSGNHILLDLDGSGIPLAVVSLDTSNGHWATLANALQARAGTSAHGSKAALRMRDGSVLEVRLTKGYTADRVVGQLKDCRDWEYDFTSKTLFSLEDKCVTFAKGYKGERRRVRLPLRYTGEDLYWQPERNELWVTVLAPFSWSGFASYSVDGRFLGSLENPIFTLGRITEATQDVRVQLSRSGFTKKPHPYSPW